MRHFALASASVILVSLAFGAGCSSATDNTSTGGSSNGGASTGGTSNAGATSTGGMPNGGASTGGTPSTGGSGGAVAKPPACLAGETKGGPCTTAGVACYKTCGPKSVGWKPETCNGTTYDEGACQFDAVCSACASGDYSCFKIPEPLTACGATPVRASDPCDAADCMPCGPDYLDSSGAAKVGYCVCNDGDNDPTTPGKWSCASSTAWPCPNGAGCN